jgi:hypothetical protein
MTVLWGMVIHVCVALSVEQSLTKSYQQTIIYKLGVWRITMLGYVKTGFQLRLWYMLCFGEITEWRCHLHELPCLRPWTSCADMSAPGTGAPLCTVVFWNKDRLLECIRSTVKCRLALLYTRIADMAFDILTALAVRTFINILNR